MRDDAPKALHFSHTAESAAAAQQHSAMMAFVTEPEPEPEPEPEAALRHSPPSKEKLRDRFGGSTIRFLHEDREVDAVTRQDALASDMKESKERRSARVVSSIDDDGPSEPEDTLQTTDLEEGR